MNWIILAFLSLQIFGHGRTSDFPVPPTPDFANPNNAYEVISISSETNCTENLTFSRVTGTCVDDAALKRISQRAPCKNLTLSAAFFDIDRGRLRVNGSTTTAVFAEEDYALTNNTGRATLCYPFTPRFMSCVRWGMNPNEYELRKGGLLIWIFPYESLIDTGDFYVRPEDELAVVCVTDSSNSSDGSPGELRENFNLIDVYAAAWTVSAVSIAVSLIVYGVVNRGKMKSHTKILMSHMGSLFVFYLILIIRGWGPNPMTSWRFCVVVSVAVHYFFLASFFWMNALAFDIWKHLPRFSTVEKSTASERRRFRLMSVYAWGCPGVVALAAVLTDHLAPVQSFYKPNFSQICWFATVQSKAVFMNGPAAFLLAVNVVFYVLTIVNLRAIGKDAVLVNKKIHNQLMRMYFKLMVVMGLCWVMEVISSSVGNFNRYWYFTDIINALQGFFLFLVYACKRSVLRDLISCWKKSAAFARLKRKSPFSDPSGENSIAFSTTNREDSSDDTTCDFDQNTTTTSQMSSTSPMPSHL